MRILAQFLIVGIRNRPSFSRNINYNINSLLWLRVGTHIILIYSMYTVCVYLDINDNNTNNNNNYCPCIL